MAKSKLNAQLPTNLFEIEPDPEHWRGMPEFKQEDNGPYRQVIVSLEDEQAVKDFFKLIGQSYTDKTKSVWFPDRAMNRVTDLFWFGAGDEDTE
jgi:hypothetical protein